jgi:hypothetical protein
LSKKRTNIRHSRRKYRPTKASDNMVAPLKKTCQLSVTRKQPPKKKTAKTTRIQRNPECLETMQNNRLTVAKRNKTR